jgi:outer membrane protein OmpA-like peptidoglycan-associated protein
VSVTALGAQDSLTKASSLTPAQKSKIDPIVTKFRSDPTLLSDKDVRVEIGGFADVGELKPHATSEARALAVQDYLVARGVPRAHIRLAGFFGTSWPLFPGGGANAGYRRVQLRIHR